jgi:hypothetical protein
MATPHEPNQCAAHGPLISKLDSIAEETRGNTAKLDRVLDLLRGPLDSPTDGGMRATQEIHERRIVELEESRKLTKATAITILGRVAAWVITAALGGCVAIMWSGGGK